MEPKAENISSTESISSLITAIRSNALKQRHRACVVIHGTTKWCDAVSQLIFQQSRSRSIISTSASEINQNGKDEQKPPITRINHEQARLQLGHEYDLVFFDCDDNFPPDALGILGGTVKEGGLLVLTISRFKSSNDGRKHQSRFMARFLTILEQNGSVTHLKKNTSTPVSPEPSLAPTPDVDYTEQNHAIESVVKVHTGQRKKPVIIYADRGRGKSAALGIAASNLLTNGISIGVTAISRKAAETVFKHANPCLENSTGTLHFYPIDALIDTKQPIDILLVDEAATISLELLAKLLQIYPRIAFASTVHGYEGTGKGFALSFSTLLDKHSRGKNIISLTTPIRWAENDPVERLLFDLLLLDAEPINHQLTTEKQTIHPTDSVKNDIEIALIDRDKLVSNEMLLRDTFGLLSQAHYRTRPSDLKFFLDNEQVRIIAYSQNGIVLGVAVIVLEGPLDSGTADAVWKNTSRPKGHLIPEILSAQIGFYDAANLRIARVVRIVVHSENRRAGIASRLIDFIENEFGHDLDLIATTFSATVGTLKFWKNNDFFTARCGVTKSSHTGNHSCVLFKPISEIGIVFGNKVLNRFLENFQILLGSDLNSLNPELAALLCFDPRPSNTRPHFNQEDFDNLLSFGYLDRNVDGVARALANISFYFLSQREITLEKNAQHLVIERILQNKSWRDCEVLTGSEGKNKGMELLREAVKILLKQMYPDETKCRLAHYNLN
jgi:tRNA(Met) cytidine acetyltransferase